MLISYFMKLSLSLCLLFCGFVFSSPEALAHEARFVEAGQHDVTSVTDVLQSQAFYGELNDSPHLFEFTLTEPTTSFAELLVPDSETGVTDKSGLLLKVEERGVTEVMRMNAKDAAWESFFEWFGGDSYRRGPTYFDSLEAGTYQLEVSTPVNQGKYVLVIGKEESFRLSYIATLKDVARVKQFFGKSRFALFESPLVYVPLLLVMVCGVVAWCIVRRVRGITLH
jgi:hypothetical protein